jgi:hypothetical protein
LQPTGIVFRSGLHNNFKSVAVKSPDFSQPTRPTITPRTP